MNQTTPLIKPPLKELILWVTTACNLRCRYCYVGGMAPEHMGWETARRAMDIMLEQGDGFTVQFAGGEPLLNLPLIERVISYVKDKNIRFQLQTNATLIDRKTAVKIRDLQLAVGVSIDGLPAANDSLRPFTDGRGSTSAVTAGIVNLRNQGVKTGLTCVLSEDNIAGLPRLVELASYFGNIEGFSLDLLRPAGRAVEKGPGRPDPAKTADAVKQALRRAEELAAAGGNAIKFREVERMENLRQTGKKRDYHCYAEAGQLLLVKPDGDAYPCPSLTQFAEFYLGNIMEPDFTLLTKDRIAKTLQLLTRPAVCMVCTNRGLCGGPCPAQTYLLRLAGEVNPAECLIKKVFINYDKRKGTPDHAATSPSRLPV